MALILLVDDDACLRPLYAEALTMAGHEVVTAPDGIEAMRLADSRRFDLLITDIIMPGRDGIEILMALRKTQPAIRIIAMSGGGRIAPSSYLTVAKPLGADATLAKPFELQDLLGTISRVLQKDA